MTKHAALPSSNPVTLRRSHFEADEKNFTPPTGLLRSGRHDETLATFQTGLWDLGYGIHSIGGGDGYVVISRGDTNETSYCATWVRDHELCDLLADEPGPHVITPTALPVTKARTKRRTA